jgi:hypothetical protein
MLTGLARLLSLNLVSTKVKTSKARSFLLFQCQIGVTQGAGSLSITVQEAK